MIKMQMVFRVSAKIPKWDYFSILSLTNRSKSESGLPIINYWQEYSVKSCLRNEIFVTLSPVELISIGAVKFYGGFLNVLSIKKQKYKRLISRRKMLQEYHCWFINKIYKSECRFALLIISKKTKNIFY